MNMNIDLSTVVQGVMVLVLAGVGKAVWVASIAIAKLGTAFDAHAAQDSQRFAEVQQAIHELRTTPPSASVARSKARR